MSKYTTRKRYIQRLGQTVKHLETAGQYNFEMAEVYGEHMPEVAAFLYEMNEALLAYINALQALKRTL